MSEPESALEQMKRLLSADPMECDRLLRDFNEASPRVLSALTRMQAERDEWKRKAEAAEPLEELAKIRARAACFDRMLEALRWYHQIILEGGLLTHLGGPHAAEECGVCDAVQVISQAEAVEGKR